ncbi:tetratricopeptide repeat protein [Salidesulfovibrio onnuriiensis]|uniref:tetratricopeptide repeat protein n=1 Tax=Salidesulfovibrio onnuriiensis TaxID=2583823 RepID=UPI0011CCD6A6|nr:tetratricopeptide repeat protein [Salidesulfovibrio onnuriiensis]
MNTARIFLAACALVLLLAGPASAKVPPLGRQALHKAQLLMDDKQYAQAAAMLHKYMESTREDIHAQVYLALGGALHLAGEKKQALSVFRKGHQAFPEDEFLCLNTGVVLYEMEQYAEAGRLFEKTHGLQKTGKPELLFQAGSAFYLGEDYKDAARVLQKLIAQSKEPRKEWIRLAIHSLIDAKQTRQAESMLLNYLNASPEDADYWKLLAKLHLDRESYSRAAAALEICCRLDEPSRQDLERLAAIYNYQQAPLMAAATLQRAYGASPSLEQALKIAALYASAGRTQQAVNYLDRHSKGGAAALEKGRMLYRSRRFEEAETALAPLAKSGSQPEARFFLALCAWERKDWKRARQELTRIAGLKEYMGQAKGYLAVLEDLEAVRREAGE